MLTTLVSKPLRLKKNYIKIVIIIIMHGKLWLVVKTLVFL